MSLPPASWPLASTQAGQWVEIVIVSISRLTITVNLWSKMLKQLKRLLIAIRIQ